MSKKKKPQKRDKSVKYRMIALAGTRCMQCGTDVGSEITWHHLKPRYAGGQDTLDNTSLLCSNCHTHIHRFQWGDPEYTHLTKEILENRERFTGVTDLIFSFD